MVEAKVKETRTRASRAKLWRPVVPAMVAILAGANLLAQAPPPVDVSTTVAASSPEVNDLKPTGGDAKPLSLQQAVAIALEHNPLRKAALAETKAALADIREARSALLPRLTFSESATRGNDPVYVFGTRLRQGRFTLSDFALNRLNSPTPIGDFNTRIGGQWNLFDSLATPLGIRRAKIMHEAAGQQLARADQELLLRVVNSYYGLLLALRQQELAHQTLQTADVILINSKARYDSGVVVESDYLSSRVNSAARQQEVIRSDNGVLLAQAQLTNALGVVADVIYRPIETLAERTLPVLSLEQAEKRALENRPDLKQLNLQERAQAATVEIAKASFGPRLSAFGNWGLDNPTFVAGGGGNNWTAGVELQFDLFSGGAKTARLAHEKAMQERVVALRQAAGDAVRLEVRRAWYDADTARRQLEVTRASIAQAEESLRINQNRYGAGLTTITDLLRAEDAAHRSRTEYWQAVYNCQTAYANLELAMGTLNSASPVVSQ